LRFAGIFGNCVVDCGNIAEHQPNTVVKGSAAKLCHLRTDAPLPPASCAGADSPPRELAAQEKARRLTRA
jgi:hypothetical protein